MRVRVPRAGLAAGLMCAQVLAQPAPAEPPAPVFEVRGRIVAASSGQTLPRARVGVIAEGADADAVLTDDEGRFAAVLRRPSGVTLAITKAGYAAKRVLVPREEVVSGTVGEHELDAGAAIAGRIVEAAGAPVVGAAVTARRMNGPDLDGAPKQWAAETDDRGEYRIGGLAPGHYVVATARGDVSPPVAVAIARGDDMTGVNLVLAPPEPTRPVDVRPAARPEAYGGRAGVQGRILSDTGEPLGGATVRLRRPGAVAHQATADADGGFAIGGVPAGPFKLQGTKAGYVTLEYGQKRANETGKTLHLGPNETIRGLTLVLPRGSVIAGTVADEHGEPIEGAIVRALQLRHAAGRTVALQVPGVRERRTDDRGQFRLFGLLPGGYLVSALVDAAVSTPGLHGGRGYAPSFYPGTTDVRDAWRVRLDVSLDEFGANIVLAPAPAVRIVGFAFGGDGRALKGTVLLATSHRSRAVTLEPRTAPLAPDGSFLLTNVPPGDYVIQALGARGDGNVPELATELLTIAETDPPSVTLTTSPGATLEGRVVVEGRTSRERAEYALMPFPADFDSAPLIGRGATVDVDRFGWFKASGLRGPTRFVLTGAPAGWYLESAIIGGREAIDAPFDFGSRYAHYGARIVIATTGATISGSVTGDGSTPLSDYTVAVFHTDRSKWFAHSRFLAFARPSHDDTFVVAGLPPAEYFLAAVERLDATAGGGEWQDPAVLDTLAGDATRVTVRDGDALTLTLRLVRR
ncbi:MAG: MSCRAMM family protein [Vicinamibacterales bacterium]